MAVTVAAIVVNLLENWGVEDWLPHFTAPALAGMVEAMPELLLELHDRFGHPVDLPVVEALAFHIVDQRGPA